MGRERENVCAKYPANMMKDNVKYGFIQGFEIVYNR